MLTADKRLLGGVVLMKIGEHIRLSCVGHLALCCVCCMAALRVVAPATALPRPPYRPPLVPFTTLSVKGRPALDRLLTRNRVFYAGNYLRAERWLYLISPTDRQMLLRHDFVQSGVLAIFHRSLTWGQRIQVNEVRADESQDLYTTISLSPPPLWCVVQQGQPPPPCLPGGLLTEYVLIAVSKAALPSQPLRLFVSEVS
ncbi:MAG: hypothetical protein WBB74_02385 [Gaiellaceae bacterium]